MVRDVAVVGVGSTSFGQFENAGIRELGFEAFKEALEDADLNKEEIQLLITGSTGAGQYYRQRHPAGTLTDYLDIWPTPAFTVDTACASSTTSTAVGWHFVKSGVFDLVAIIGVQKMSEFSGAEIQEVMGTAGDAKWESPMGTMMPTYFALRARKYMKEYGADEKDLARVRKKSSEYASQNPKAMFQKKFEIEDILESNTITSPLKLLDCCANADGAAAVILASDDKARELTDNPVWITGIGMGTGPVSLYSADDLLKFPPTVESSRRAYKMAGIKPEDVEVNETHDCFTIAELLDYEDLGFCERGKGVEFLKEGQSRVGGKVPVNPDGGLLGKGHPVGATGSSQIYSVTKWLRGEKVGEIEVPAETGLVYTRGGVGMYGASIVLER